MDKVIYRADVAEAPQMEIVVRQDEDGDCYALLRRNSRYVASHAAAIAGCAPSGIAASDQAALRRLGKKLEAIAAQCREAAADIA